MDIQVVPFKKLKAAKYNPRKQLKAGDAAFEALKKSIETFDYIEPIIWNKRTGNVVGGHQRLTVLKDMGRTEGEVSIVDLAPDDEKALNIALNKIAGEWDEDMLAGLFGELDGAHLALTGFDLWEIDAVLGKSDPQIDDEPEDDGPNMDDEGINYESQYGVIVQCGSEIEQQAIYDNLTRMGYTCKVVVV